MLLYVLRSHQYQVLSHNIWFYEYLMGDPNWIELECGVAQLVWDLPEAYKCWRSWVFIPLPSIEYWASVPQVCSACNWEQLGAVVAASPWRHSLSWCLSPWTECLIDIFNQHPESVNYATICRWGGGDSLTEYKISWDVKTSDQHRSENELTNLASAPNQKNCWPQKKHPNLLLRSWELSILL